MPTPAAPAGYSGTPLAKKLGVKPSTRFAIVGAPPGYRTLLEPIPEGVVFQTEPGPDTDLVQVFVTQREVLSDRLRSLRRILKPETPVWVSWPKKSSGVASTVTEDVVREVALPLGFVDVKVCAVDAVWSGLKVVVRREHR